MSGAAAWGRWLVLRLLHALPPLAGVFTLVFFLVHLAPGDPVVLLAGEGATPEHHATVRALYGLDRSLPEQFLRYVLLLARGHLGYSFIYQQPAAHVVLERLPATLVLTGSSLALGLAVGITLGIAAVLAGRGTADRILRIVSSVIFAVPVFFLGQLLILVFGLRLELFPIAGMSSARSATYGLDHVADLVHHLALPATTLALSFAAIILRVTRTSVAEALEQAYAQAARARGMGRVGVVVRHALPNAIVPIVTLAGHQVGLLLTGAALTESLFAWPGLGRLLLDATLQRDYPLVLAVFLAVAFMVIVANIVTDALYVALDPRVRLS